MSAPEEKAPPVEVPLDAISSEALAGVIDNFILREGTDYGRNEVSHDSKVQTIRKQLSKGFIKIIYDANEDSVTLMTKIDWEKL